MIQSFPWNMELISWQLAQNDCFPVSLTAACAASPSAKRSGRLARWYEDVRYWRTSTSSRCRAPPRPDRSASAFFLETASRDKSVLPCSRQGSYRWRLAPVLSLEG